MAQSIEATHSVDGLAFGVDGQSVILSVNMRGSQVYDLTSGEMLIDFDDSGYDPTLALSQDGEMIASGVRGRLVKLLRVSDGELLLEIDPSNFLDDYDEWVTSLAYSPDGAHIAAGYWDGHIFVWDTSNGDLVYIITPESNFCSAWDLAFSADGAYLAVGGANHELSEVIKIYHAADGSQAHILDAYSRGGAISAPVAFSPDGNLFAAGANDGIFIWSLPEFSMLHHIEIEAVDISDWVTDLDFSPDGHRLLASYWDGYALVWQVQE